MSSPDTTSSQVLGAGLLAALTLPRLTLAELFMLPGDPLPQAITRLTGLGKADVHRLIQADTEEAMAQALRDNPTELYCFALVAELNCLSPQGRATLARHFGADMWDALARPLAALIDPLLVLLTAYLPQPEAVADLDAGVRAAFDQLSFRQVPPLVPVTPPTEDDEADDTWLTMYPKAREQRLMVLALSLTLMARVGVPHPLGAALATVPALGSDAQLHQLAQRIKAAPPKTLQELNGPDLIRLYLSLHTLALLCVTDLQPALMARLSERPDGAEPWQDPELQQRFVTWVGTYVEALSSIFDEQFGHEPAYQAAQAEVQRLAQLA